VGTRGGVHLDPAIEQLDPATEFEWLFRTEYRPVLRTVMLVVRDLGRAEDITQEAFVQILGHWSTSPGTNVRAHGCVAERLVRSDPFRSLHRRIVAVLERIGDVGTLSGDELREVLVDDPRVPPPFRGHRASDDGLCGARVEDGRRSSNAVRGVRVRPPGSPSRGEP
jgi:DNA-directed RNA polymerase specialized sigma24 family protein